MQDTLESTGYPSPHDAQAVRNSGIWAGIYLILAPAIAFAAFLDLIQAPVAVIVGLLFLIALVGNLSALVADS